MKLKKYVPFALEKFLDKRFEINTNMMHADRGNSFKKTRKVREILNDNRQ